MLTQCDPRAAVVRALEVPVLKVVVIMSIAAQTVVVRAERAPLTQVDSHPCILAVFSVVRDVLVMVVLHEKRSIRGRGPRPIRGLRDHPLRHARVLVLLRPPRRTDVVQHAVGVERRLKAESYTETCTPERPGATPCILERVGQYQMAARMASHHLVTVDVLLDERFLAFRVEPWAWKEKGAHRGVRALGSIPDAVRP